jgi:hypothetical protein
MAQHIDSVAGSSLPKVTKAQFWQLLRPGDRIFCWGQPLISRGIEDFTAGPSHVLQLWLPWPTAPWLTQEAVYGHGVRVGVLSRDYVGVYDGDLVLCRRPLSDSQVRTEIETGFDFIGEKYDTIEFASMVARKISDKFPLIQPANELFCSGFDQVKAEKTVPYEAPSRPWATPEQLFSDPKTADICALLKGAA